MTCWRRCKGRFVLKRGRTLARVATANLSSLLSLSLSLCQSVDKFTWDHPDFLSVFAAGNYGSGVNQLSTVSSPAVSKNCIAVGAGVTLKPGSGV